MTSPLKDPNERGCYCDGINAEFRQKQNIPEGYCGICERCGNPGHARHFPGPVPYTGAWCDRCYRIVVWMWPIRSPIIWFILIILAVMSWLTFKHFF